MNSLVSIDSCPGLNRRIERRVALARAAVLWERAWPLLWPALGIAGSLPARRPRLLAARSPVQRARVATLDPRIAPPGFPGEPPLDLPRGTSNKTVALPAASVVALRVHGGRTAPQLTLVPRPSHAPSFSGQNEDYAANGKLARDENVNVIAGGATLGSWHIKAIPDEPPSIAFAQPPSR